uniref:Mitochondrial carrier protein Rim2 n=1 Tax=Panagrellus redivivus TaxID=6233 RepID=A0A7E4UXN1_PANRE
MDAEALIHFIGGAAGGTAGTAITCPLEVIKTRLQSARHGFEAPGGPGTAAGAPGTASTSNASGETRGGGGRELFRRVEVRPKTGVLQGYAYGQNYSTFQLLRRLHTKTTAKAKPDVSHRALFKYTADIVKKEGVPALYKGLVPNIIGVAPSKAVYFYTYSSTKRFFNTAELFIPNSAIVHMVSAGFAGFVTSTVINPVWLVKTRLQLHHGPLTIRECVKRIYKKDGLKGYYRGVTASYMGISETIIQFVLYEHFRGIIDDMDWAKENTKYINFMIAGGVAKFCACILTYPHEVVRTRLREEDSRSKGFFKTLGQLYREGGYRTMYRGLSVQLLRSVPNTAITMGTYETVVRVLHAYFA